ncbi:MAG: acylphosphatase [Lacisediminihabitans sp.]
MIRKNAIVRGRVQGVGFRCRTQAEARRLGLSGFARNRLDGSVEVELEGGEASVAQMLDWLASGPSWATVESVQVTDLASTGDTEFRIG